MANAALAASFATRRFGPASIRPPPPASLVSSPPSFVPAPFPHVALPPPLLWLHATIGLKLHAVSRMYFVKLRPTFAPGSAPSPPQRRQCSYNDLSSHGFEIGCPSLTHPHLTDMDASRLTKRLKGAKDRRE